MNGYGINIKEDFEFEYEDDVEDFEDFEYEYEEEDWEDEE